MIESANNAAAAEAEGRIDRHDRVLIVDDEAGIRELFIAIIAHDLPRLQLDQACNGKEALEHFQRRRHSVLIMDLHMPIMDGLTSFFKIRQFCENSAVRMPAVIFCTGFAPPASVRDVIKGSMLHHLLPKPVKSEILVHAISTRLDLRQRSEF